MKKIIALILSLILFLSLANAAGAEETKTAAFVTFGLGGDFFQTLANTLGLLFIRAYERAEKVHRAMQARGYRGIA